MARCGCSSECSCTIIAGDGVTVTGTGVPGDPYIVESSASPSAIEYRDTPSVNMTFDGTGTGADPFEVSGDVKTAPAGGLKVQADGVAVKLDPRASNTLAVGPDGLRSAGEAAVELDPLGGLQVTPDGMAVKASPSSPAPVTVDASGIKVTPNLSAVTTRIDFLQHIARAQLSLSIPQQRLVNITHVSWDSNTPIYSVPVRRNTDMTAAYWQMDMPPAGTVITGIGGASNVSVPSTGNYAGMIPLDSYQALWYLPPATGSATVHANWRITLNTSSVSLPDNAILIAYRSGLAGRHVHWGDMVTQTPWVKMSAVLRANNAIALGIGSSGQQAHHYRNTTDGYLEVTGYVQWNGSGINSPVGDVYLDIPVTTPPMNVNKVNFHVVGSGKFFAADGVGGGGAMDWAVWPWIAPGSNRVFFLVNRSGADNRLFRFKLNSGNGNPPANQSLPYISERWPDQPGSEFHYQLRVPLLNPNP